MKEESKTYRCRRIMSDIGKPWYPADYGDWISFEEAQALSHGKILWWTWPGLQDEWLQPEQHRYDGPVDKPVFSKEGNMYFGKWEKHETKNWYMWHGFGIYYRHNGEIFIGDWYKGKLCGLGHRLWSPYSDCWNENVKRGSVIQKDGIGKPFLYVGRFVDNWKHDECAAAILKDGTTRVGPWAYNQPVGDWWKDHLVLKATYEVDRLLAFATSSDSAEEVAGQPNTEIEISAQPLKTTSIFAGQVLSNEVHEQQVSVKGTVASSIQVSKADRQQISAEGLGSYASLQPSDFGNSSIPEIEITFAEEYEVLDINYDQEQVSALADWLMVAVVGNGADPHEMETYARELWKLGLHSEALIQDTCSTFDVICWRWMKPYHRKVLLQWVQKNCAGNQFQRQLTWITEWLSNAVIGYNADPLEMGYYARKLFVRGHHSISSIQEKVKSEDIDSFDWMKPMHKRLFLSRYKHVRAAV